MQCEDEVVNQGAEIHFENGKLTYKKGEWREAAEHYRKGLELDRSNKEAFKNLGTALAQIEDYEGAIENFRKTIEIDPSISAVYYNLGLALS